MCSRKETWPDIGKGRSNSEASIALASDPLGPPHSSHAHYTDDEGGNNKREHF